MSIDTFNQLDLPAQQQLVAQDGDYLATRFEKEDAVLLYHLPAHSFFVELYYSPATNLILGLRALPRDAPLDNYAPGIALLTLSAT